MWRATGAVIRRENLPQGDCRKGTLVRCLEFVKNDGDRPATEVVEGRVQRTVYYDPDSRYTVMRVALIGRLDVVTIVGRTQGPDDGAEIRVNGCWIEHPTHGEQFSAERVEIKEPTSRVGVIRRLQRYPGIKEVMAERIVETFGDATLHLLDKDPRRLLEVEGIGKKTLERLVAFHETRAGPIVAVENRLIELDVSPRFADGILRRYGKDALETLTHHPYRLARDVRGIGFATADRIARSLGVGRDSEGRIDAGLLHTVERGQNDGHCALPWDRLVRDGSSLLDQPPDKVSEGVDRLLADGDLVLETVDGTKLCYPRDFLRAEENVARALADLALADKKKWKVIDLPEELSPGQVRAVEAMAANGAVILTGGPGTGKSTVVRHVIELAEANDLELLLAAPTGRAAKRLEQTTGRSASTVHRLLEIQGDNGEFVYNANNPLPPALVVIDESSMLDLELAEALLTALTTEHRLLLVGDADQLPSVGPGNVLRDLIVASEHEESPIAIVRLNQIFRQAEGSTIVVNAHHVLHGEALSPDSAGSDGEFFVMRTRDAERAHEVIVKMIVERIPEVYGLDPMSEIQVLCPMHKGRAGTDSFNLALQEKFTGGNGHLEVAGIAGGPRRKFCVGDRVMQMRNDYNRNVFNGDIGTVRSVDTDRQTLVAEVDGVAVQYERKDFGALRLAYAISIHKSQGSEFPAVLIPLLAEHHVMLRRNLLYTAMTRARRLCILVGDMRAITRAISRADAAHRYTGLDRRLVAELGNRLGAVSYHPSDD